jgi:hypothetical protein
MGRHWLALLVFVTAVSLSGDTALAKESGFHSSSGHSFSSGRSFSSGSHGFSSGSHSYSSGSHGFSSGGSSSHGFSSGRSYSSGGGRSSPSGGSASHGFSSPGSGSSNRSFSSGGFDARSNPAKPSAARPSSTTPFSSGRSYSSGGGSAVGFPSGKSYSSDEARHAQFGTRPSHGNYDASAGAMKQREASRSAYVAGQAPRTTYVDPVGRSQPINPESPVVRQLRSDLNYERWQNRELRERQYYGNYWGGWYSARPVYAYRDPFSDLFWYWLLSQNFNMQAQWAYNYRNMMDDARYRDLLARDSRIEQEIRNLEQQGVLRDPTQAPVVNDGGTQQALPPDLMYNDSYVQAVYNPQPQAGRSAGASFFHAVSRFLIIAGIALVLVWLVFFKRWGGSTSIGRF